MAIYVAENGVGRFDIFIALKAIVTFSTKLNDYRSGWGGRGDESEKRRRVGMGRNRQEFLRETRGKRMKRTPKLIKRYKEKRNRG